jgi:predicted HicB family RNase H-like nuclease
MKTDDAKATIPQNDKPDNRIAFRTSDELHERIRIQAIKSRITIQELCTEALVRHLDSIADTTA